MNSPYKRRIKEILTTLKRSRTDVCMLLTSAPEMLKTRDQYYPFRQDSDFFYVTGIQEPSLTLFISSKGKHPLLIAPVIDKVKALWDGAPINYALLAKSIGAELVISKDIFSEIKKSIRVHTILLHQNRPGSISERIAREIQSLSSHARGNFPTYFAHVDTVLEEMRLVKDTHEVNLIKEACSITAQAIAGTAPMIQPGNPEHSIARTIDYWFGMLGATPAFQTIAATGKSAATLHYHRGDQFLKKGELFLLDCGAEYCMYNGDITRTFPVGGKFSPEQRDLYLVVLNAQKAAIKKVRHGVLIKKVYDAAAKALVEGLKDLKVLKGNTDSLIKKGAHKLYFPHGIGHSLGIDVHDAGNHRGNNDAVLREGMVFTIEPGIYFARKTGRFAPCGIRIEDDVLVKRNGCEVLTQDMPKDPDALEVFLTE